VPSSSAVAATVLPCHTTIGRRLIVRTDYPPSFFSKNFLGLNDDDGDDDDNDDGESICGTTTGSDLRAGASLQRAEVPVGAGARSAGEHDRPVADPGEDLVPESPLQGQERPAGPQRADSADGGLEQRARGAADGADASRTRQGGAESGRRLRRLLAAVAERVSAGRASAGRRSRPSKDEGRGAC